MASTSSPTVIRRRLAAELRRLRDQAGLTIEQVAAQLEWSNAKISRIENARNGILPRDMRHLLRVYDIDPESSEGQLMVTLARESRTRGWWQQYGDAIPSWFELFVGLEEVAAGESSYDSEFVPGLLQTEAYARLILSFSALLGGADDMERRVAVRMARKKLLDSDAQLWFVLNEAVLMRLVGGRPVMHEQISHLLSVSERPNVTLQVLPFDSGAHLAMGGSFSILTFPQASDPQVAYIEYQTGALYREDEEEVRLYRLMMDHLRGDALSADASRGLMARRRDELA